MYLDANIFLGFAVFRANKDLYKVTSEKHGPDSLQ